MNWSVCLTRHTLRRLHLHFGVEKAQTLCDGTNRQSLIIKLWISLSFDTCFHLNCVSNYIIILKIMDLGGNNECFGCGRTGHWIKDCPKSSNPRGRGPRGRGRGKGKTKITLRLTPCHVTLFTSDVTLTCFTLIVCRYRAVLLSVWRARAHRQGLWSAWRL